MWKNVCTNIYLPAFSSAGFSSWLISHPFPLDWIKVEFSVCPVKSDAVVHSYSAVRYIVTDAQILKSGGKYEYV